MSAPRTEILKLILELAAADTAVLLISSEIEELTRILRPATLIMSHGRIAGELAANRHQAGSPRGRIRPSRNGRGAIMTAITAPRLGRFALRTASCW